MTDPIWLVIEWIILSIAFALQTKEIEEHYGLFDLTVTGVVFSSMALGLGALAVLARAMVGYLWMLI